MRTNHHRYIVTLAGAHEPCVQPMRIHTLEVIVYRAKQVGFRHGANVELKPLIQKIEI